MIAKPLVLGAALLSIVLSRPAVALPQDVGELSCRVVAGYIENDPAYVEVFWAYVAGYLAAQMNPGRSLHSSDVAKVASRAIEICNMNPILLFAAAVAAAAPKPVREN
jgi:hypothetical protein